MQHGTVKPLLGSYAEIMTVLDTLQNDMDQKHEIRSKAEGLLRKMKQLYLIILTAIWAKIMNRFNATNVALQVVGFVFLNCTARQ